MFRDVCQIPSLWITSVTDFRVSVEVARVQHERISAKHPTQHCHLSVTYSSRRCSIERVQQTTESLGSSANIQLYNAQDPPECQQQLCTIHPSL